MKNLTLIGMLAVLLAATMNSKASLYAVGSIPDGNPLGVSFTGTYDQATPGDTVSGLTVDLSISGGYNGNLYAYLVAPNGTMVGLLNQPGATISNPFGCAGSGLNVTLSESAAGSIQTTPEIPGSVFGLGLAYQAAGSLSGFNGSAADGTWMLFFADEAPGGGQAILNGWSLNITAVPEPANMALVIFGVGFIGVGIARYFRSSRKAVQYSPQITREMTALTS
jgi:subtilisin-like proprotein convertase family protein